MIVNDLSIGIFAEPVGTHVGREFEDVDETDRLGLSRCIHVLVLGNNRTEDSLGCVFLVSCNWRLEVHENCHIHYSKRF